MAKPATQAKGEWVAIPCHATAGIIQITVDDMFKVAWLAKLLNVDKQGQVNVQLVYKQDGDTLATLQIIEQVS